MFISSSDCTVYLTEPGYDVQCPVVFSHPRHYNKKLVEPVFFFNSDNLYK